MSRSRRNSTAGTTSASSQVSPPRVHQPAAATTRQQKKRRRRCMRLVLTVTGLVAVTLVGLLYPPFNLYHSPLTIKFPYSSLPTWGLQEIYHDPITHAATFTDHRDRMVDWSRPPPGFLYRIAEWLVNYIEVTLPARVVPAPLHLMRLMQGPGQLQVLRTITLLGIPDLLADRVLSLRDLHAALVDPAHQVVQRESLRAGIYVKDATRDADAGLPRIADLPLAKLERLMSFALSIGYFEEVGYRGSHIYVHNQQSVILRKDHPNNLNHLLFHFSNEAYLAWHDLPHALLTAEDTDPTTNDGADHVIDAAIALELDQMAGTDTETVWRTGKGVFSGPKAVETFGVPNPANVERKEKRMRELRAAVNQAAATATSQAAIAPPAMTAWEKALGQPLWPFFRTHAALGANFARGMAEVDHIVNHALVVDYPWASHHGGEGHPVEVDLLVDVGGALGSFLYEVLAAYPTIPKATLFDLEESIGQARPMWQAGQGGAYASVLAHTQVDLVSGDFFSASSIPAPSTTGPTRYVLRQILHDWSDRQAMLILRNLRQAVGRHPGGRDVSVVLVEVNRAVGDASSSHMRHWLDFQMMVCCNAQERTPASWKTLLAATGWRITHTQPTRSMFQIIEVQPDEEYDEETPAANETTTTTATTTTTPPATTATTSQPPQQQPPSAKQDL